MNKLPLWDVFLDVRQKDLTFIQCFRVAAGSAAEASALATQSVGADAEVLIADVARSKRRHLRQQPAQVVHCSGKAYYELE